MTNGLPPDSIRFKEDRCPDELPGDFTDFDDETPNELPADFAGFDDDCSTGPCAPHAPPPSTPQASTLPAAGLEFSQLLDPLPPEERDRIMAFTQALGATVTHVMPRGEPDPIFPRCAPHDWDTWSRRRDEQIFARARAAKGGKSFSEQAQEAEEEKKREHQLRKEWLDRQRLIAHAWARWMRWRQQDPQAADEYRDQHQGADGGDRDWLIAFASQPAPPVPVGCSVKRNKKTQRLGS
jgi:hypothetical protein